MILGTTMVKIFNLLKAKSFKLIREISRKYSID